MTWASKFLELHNIHGQIYTGLQFYCSSICTAHHFRTLSSATNGLVSWLHFWFPSLHHLHQHRFHTHSYYRGAPQRHHALRSRTHAMQPILTRIDRGYSQSAKSFQDVSQCFHALAHNCPGAQTTTKCEKVPGRFLQLGVHLMPVRDHLVWGGVQYAKFVVKLSPCCYELLQFPFLRKEAI